MNGEKLHMVSTEKDLGVNTLLIWMISYWDPYGSSYMRSLQSTTSVDATPLRAATLLGYHHQEPNGNSHKLFSQGQNV